jgi:hypothetical protein
MAAVMRSVTHTDAAIIERSWHEPERFARSSTATTPRSTDSPRAGLAGAWPTTWPRRRS